MLKEVAKVTETLEGWTKEFYAEEERALRGLGKYRLAPGYEHFLVDPVTWNKWGPPATGAAFVEFSAIYTQILQHLQQAKCCWSQGSSFKESTKMQPSRAGAISN